MRIRIARVLPTVVLAAMLTACTQNDMGSEYEEIAEEKTNLVFYGPGLNGGYRQFLTGKSPRYDTVTIGIYGPGSGSFPRAQIVLHEAAPQRHFLTAPSLSKYVAKREFFKGRDITPGKEGETNNAAGSIRYLTFLADTMPCVAFVQFMGVRDEGGLGDKRLLGFYCRGEGQPAISAGEAVEIVKTIGHRKHGAPEPPKGWDGARSKVSPLS